MRKDGWRQLLARWRTPIKYSGLLLCAIWLASFWVAVGYGNARKRIEFRFGAGAVMLSWDSVSNEFPRNSEAVNHYVNYLEGATIWTGDSGHDIEALLWPSSHRFGSILFVTVPLWPAIGPIVLYSGVLWWRDRRPPKGHCQNCRYNLTGNVSGICPECGCATRSLGKEDCDMSP
jgi:hypothetical protein